MAVEKQHSNLVTPSSAHTNDQTMQPSQTNKGSAGTGYESPNHPFSVNPTTNPNTSVNEHKLIGNEAIDTPDSSDNP